MLQKQYKKLMTEAQAVPPKGVKDRDFEDREVEMEDEDAEVGEEEDAAEATKAE